MTFVRTNQARQTDTAKNAADSVSVGVASTTLVAANPNRIAVYITNDHATNTVYLALGGTALINKGIRLNAAGGGACISEYSGIITAIASGATTTVTFSEV